MWNRIKNWFRPPRQWTVHTGKQVVVDGHSYVITEIVWRSERDMMVMDIRLTSAYYIRQQMDLHGR